MLKNGSHLRWHKEITHPLGYHLHKTRYKDGGNGRALPSQRHVPKERAVGEADRLTAFTHRVNRVQIDSPAPLWGE